MVLGWDPAYLQCNLLPVLHGMLHASAAVSCISKQQLQLLSLARGPTEPDMPKALDVCGEAIGNGRKVTTEGLDGGGSA